MIKVSYYVGIDLLFKQIISELWPGALDLST